jgi:hypothetical protein
VQERLVSLGKSARSFKQIKDLDGETRAQAQVFQMDHFEENLLQFSRIEACPWNGRGGVKKV